MAREEVAIIRARVMSVLKKPLCRFSPDICFRPLQLTASPSFTDSRAFSLKMREPVPRHSKLLVLWNSGRRKYQLNL